MGGVYIAGSDPIPTKGWEGSSGQDDFDSVLFLFAPRKGLHSIGDLQHCLNCEYIWLAGNTLDRLNRLSGLCYLRFLDVSCNQLRDLPDAGFFAALRCLQILFLHDNDIQKMSAIAGLAGSSSLRVLTLHSTPLASMATYRAMILSLCPSLLCLDGAVVTDKDTLPQGHEMLPAMTFFSDLHRSVLTPVMSVDEHSAYEHHALAHLYIMLETYRNYGCARAHLVLQRVLRGHWGRLTFRGRRRVIIPAVCTLQRWLMRRYIQTNVLLAYCTASAQPPARRLAALKVIPQANHVGWMSMRHEEDALYFLASDILGVQALIKGCRKIYSAVCVPEIELTDVCVFRCSTQASVTPGLPLVRGVIGRLTHTHRSSAQTCRLLRIRAFPAIREIIPFSVVQRRGYAVTRQERIEFWTRVKEEHVLFNETCERVVRVYFGSRRSSVRFASVVSSVNRLIQSGAANLAGNLAGNLAASTTLSGGSLDAQTDSVHLRVDGTVLLRDAKPLRFFLPIAIRRVSAACAMQSLLRAYRLRGCLEPSLGTRLLRLRTVRLLQRWWRWQLLRLRLVVLTEAKNRAAVIFGNTLYIVTPCLRRRLKELDAAPRLLREARIPFDISHKGHTYLLPFVEERDEGRDLMPSWMGLNIPIETLPAQVPRPTILGASGVMKVKFDNVHEARVRMALILLNSWRPRTRDAILIVPEEEAVLRLQATLMQAIFRGYVSRRWFQPLRKLLSKHLNISIYDEQRGAWASHGKALPEAYACTQHVCTQQPQLVYDALHESSQEVVLLLQSDVMMLQSHNLRLAGLRPCTASSRGSDVLGLEDKMRLGSMLRFKRDVEIQEAAEHAAAKLQEQRDAIRVARDTKRILNHLRTRPTGFSLRTLAKPAMLHAAAGENEDAAARAQAERQRARMQRLQHESRRRQHEEQREARRTRQAQQQQAEQHEVEVAQLKRQTPASRPNSATQESQQQALVRTQLRRVRHDSRDFALRLASNVNLLNAHIFRAEKERTEAVRQSRTQSEVQARRTASISAALDAKLQRALSARTQSRQNRAEKTALDKFLAAKNTVGSRPIFKALEPDADDAAPDAGGDAGGASASTSTILPFEIETLRAVTNTMDLSLGSSEFAHAKNRPASAVHSLSPSLSLPQKARANTRNRPATAASPGPTSLSAVRPTSPRDTVYTPPQPSDPRHIYQQRQLGAAEGAEGGGPEGGGGAEGRGGSGATILTVQVHQRASSANPSQSLKNSQNPAGIQIPTAGTGLGLGLPPKARAVSSGPASRVARQVPPPMRVRVGRGGVVPTDFSGMSPMTPGSVKGWDTVATPESRRGGLPLANSAFLEQ